MGRSAPAAPARPVQVRTGPGHRFVAKSPPPPEGAWVRGPKQVCVPTMGLQFWAPTHFICFVRHRGLEAHSAQHCPMCVVPRTHGCGKAMRGRS